MKALADSKTFDVSGFDSIQSAERANLYKAMMWLSANKAESIYREAVVKASQNQPRK